MTKQETKTCVQSVKSYEVHDGVISLSATCLLAKRQASYRGKELYSGLVTELENLHVDDRLLYKRSDKKADIQREMADGEVPLAYPVLRNVSCQAEISFNYATNKIHLYEGKKRTNLESA